MKVKSLVIIIMYYNQSDTGSGSKRNCYIHSKTIKIVSASYKLRNAYCHGSKAYLIKVPSKVPPMKGLSPRATLNVPPVTAARMGTHVTWGEGGSMQLKLCHFYISARNLCVIPLMLFMRAATMSYNISHFF